MILTPLYRFIGSIYFALVLMTLLIFAVAIATWIESTTDSHLQASRWVYSSPLFSCILVCLFLNILFSASRRWPFQWKHLPFLIAHLGLLMVLSGVMWKQFFGLQGHMILMEGMGSHSLIHPEKIALTIEKRPSQIGTAPIATQVEISPEKKVISVDTELQINLLNYWPHGVSKNESWIKGDHLWIFGQLPLKVNQTKALHIDPWDVYALQTDEITESVKKIFAEQAFTKVPFTLELDYSLLQGWQHAVLKFSHDGETVRIPLFGERALIGSSDHSWKAPLDELTLELPPTLLFIQDFSQTVHLIAISRYGELWSKSFPLENSGPIMIYDHGFSGYGLETEIPLFNTHADTKSRLEALALARTRFLQNSVTDDSPLLPPIALFRKASKLAHTDFASVMVEFLSHWRAQRSWFLQDQISFSPELRKTLVSIPWEEPIARGCDWSIKIFEDLNLEGSSKTAFAQLLVKQWPLLEQIEACLDNKEDDAVCRQLLMQQIYDFSSQAQSMGLSDVPSASAAERLSAFLRLYDFSWNVLFELGPQDSIQTMLLEWHEGEPTLRLGTSLTQSYQSSEPMVKLEDNRPLVQLLFKKRLKQEIATLGLDRAQTQFKQPILSGDMRIRLEPLQVEIPYHIRLLDARQVMHPDSSQTSSYECRILARHRETGEEEEGLLSMNQVFETQRGGYRFYLSGMAPAQEVAPRQVNLVINQDPVRWTLTYPGAFIIALGTVLLLWMRPYKKRAG